VLDKVLEDEVALRVELSEFDPKKKKYEIELTVECEDGHSGEILTKSSRDRFYETPLREKTFGVNWHPKTLDKFPPNCIAYVQLVL
jgi:hypothetical protein